jgi:TfoX/Sxy family transcriptional regulator of competence genes
MAYDLDLAELIRELVAAERGVDERRMFGGLAFLVGGNMAVAASGKGGLLVRVPPAEADAFLADERVHQMVMAGRPTRGWLRVDATAEQDGWVGEWVGRGVAFARTLPVK